MTQDELDALPEQSTDFGMREEIRDGKLVRIPVAPVLGVLWREPNDPVRVFDIHGVEWTTGRIDGVLYKRRVR